VRKSPIKIRCFPSPLPYEQHSSHIIGQSILKYAREQKSTLSEINNFQNIAGQGIRAEIDGQEYFAGNERLLKGFNLKFEAQKNIDGTIVVVADREKVLGYLVLSR